MARRRMKSLAKARRNNKSISVRRGNPEAESDLPIEILEQIISQLSLRDNIRSSAVCRRWLAVAISVRRANKSPWLMYIPKSNDLYEFYNPSDRKSYCLKLPALESCRICYSRDGWLLLYKYTIQRLIFYCPYTRDSLTLPQQPWASRVVGFSASPTSPSCVIFSVKQLWPNIIAVSTCRPGDLEWTTIDYHIREPLVGTVLNQVVYYDGIFCCLSQSGYVGFYNVKRRIWAVLPVPRPYKNGAVKERAKYLAVHKEYIYAVCAHPTFERPTVYKLNKSNCDWEDVEDLGAITIFANSVNSLAGSDLPGNMRNNIYFPKVQYHGKCCITYSLRDQRYYPRKYGYDGAKVDRLENIWIDGPEDLSVFL